MKVTLVEKIDNTRSKIYLDGEFAFVLYKGEQRKFHISEDNDLMQEDYDTIVNEIIPKRAKLRAMNLLSKRDYTKAKLMQKLREGYYSQKVIDETIHYLESFNYINDFRYAYDYITYHESDKSVKRINLDLLAKGIEDSLIEKAFNLYEENGGKNNEEEQIKKFLKKKNYNDSMDYNDKQKLIASLLRKGFEFDAIKRVMLDIELD